MKKFLIFFCLITLLAACSKDKDQPETRLTSPIKRPIGEPIPGSVTVTKILGQQGGTISSKDGVLSVEVPAGALSSDVSFSIQPVSNTLPGSDAPSFKILPEHVTFQKPVTLHYSYAGKDMRGRHPLLLRLAYQDEAGFYKVPSLIQNDQGIKVLKVETRHSSTWTVFDYYRLDGAHSVSLNGQVPLAIKTYNLLAPLTPESDVDLAEYIEDPDSDPIVSSAGWALAGEGTLTPAVSRAIYTAPSTVPAQNPVTVSAAISGEFFGHGKGIQKLILIHPIGLEGGEYFEVNVDGVAHQVSQGIFTVITGTLYIAGKISGRDISIRVNATKKGNYSFRLPMQPYAAELALLESNDPLAYMVTWRTGCNEWDDPFIYSPGSLSISSYPAQAGEFLQGKIDDAIIYTGGNYCIDQQHKNISVKFRLLKRQ
ncbi:MAG TPA: hypothetical protein VKB19_08065 [Pedobacter sp.]|nr:hypothetical protein [Pedobacter sp.]